MKSLYPIFAILFVPGISRADDVDFNRDVRPILADKCFSCHGPDAKHRKADLRLDMEHDARESGVIVPGKPDASSLIDRITSQNSADRMPPPKTGKSLTPKEIEIIKLWIRQGAKWAPHWAYVPPKKIKPRVPSGSDWPIHEIDKFIFTRLTANGLSPSPDADRRTLIRRLHFDLTGLPPSAADVDAFVADNDPRAIDRLVDRLLASEHYGERMAMYWLDLVRYADTVGYHGDQDHHASPYRDYVIDAFNDNMPFDHFTREQLAGDLLENPTIDQRIATCYNRLLQTSHEGGVQPKEYLAIYQADRVRNLSAVWMGATVGCAQCHDHKFDPYTMKDFYSLAAFFADIDEEKHLRGGGADTVPTKRPPEIPVLSRRERQRLVEIEKRITELKMQPESPITRKQIEESLAARDALQKKQRLVMVTQSVPPRTIRILPRGNWLDESGPIVEPAVPEFLGKLNVVNRRANRLDLANWLTNPQSGIGGLTARVFVNRLWYLFFGHGLSGSLEDFGGQGEPPHHPELLDTLAVEFIASGWDVKSLVKRIVTSRAYRQSSRETVIVKDRDPENRFFARQGHWRLPAEMIRDNALFVSGLLVLDIGGPSSKPYQPLGYYRHLNFPKREYVPDKDAAQWRRGVYVHWQRQYLHPMLKAFDAPSREECTVQRPRSNTPLAALVLLNDPTFLECARVLAQRIVTEGGKDDADRIIWAFRQVTSRVPDQFEMETLIQYLNNRRQRYQADLQAANALVRTGLAPLPGAIPIGELAAWTSLCRALLNLSETNTRE